MNVAAIIMLFYFTLAAGFLSSLIKKKKESITCHVEQWVNLNSFCQSIYTDFQNRLRKCAHCGYFKTNSRASQSLMRTLRITLYA